VVYFYLKIILSIFFNLKEKANAEKEFENKFDFNSCNSFEKGIIDLYLS